MIDPSNPGYDIDWPNSFFGNLENITTINVPAGNYSTSSTINIPPGTTYIPYTGTIPTWIGPQPTTSGGYIQYDPITIGPPAFKWPTESTWPWNTPTVLPTRGEIKQAITDKNYTFLINFCNETAQIERKLHRQLEKLIVDKNDYFILSQYIQRAKYFDVSHLTKNLLILATSSGAIKNYPGVFIDYNYEKLDFRVILKAAQKSKNLSLLDFILIKPSEKVSKYISNWEVDFKTVQDIFLKYGNSRELFNFTARYPQSDRKVFFQKLKKKGTKELCETFLKTIKDPWVDALNNLR